MRTYGDCGVTTPVVLEQTHNFCCLAYEVLTVVGAFDTVWSCRWLTYVSTLLRNVEDKVVLRAGRVGHYDI
jgi:hypothetical protein